MRSLCVASDAKKEAARHSRMPVWHLILVLWYLTILRLIFSSSSAAAGRQNYVLF